MAPRIVQRKAGRSRAVSKRAGEFACGRGDNWLPLASDEAACAASFCPDCRYHRPPPAPKRAACLLYGCGALLAVLLVIGATVAITLWWIQRPIKPVVLSASEKAAVEEKLRPLSSGEIPMTSRAPASIHSAEGDRPSPVAPKEAGPKQEKDRPYVPGSKVIRLTERELNGLLNANTDLGKSLRFEFSQRRYQRLRRGAHSPGLSRWRRQDVSGTRTFSLVIGQRRSALCDT